MHHRQSSHKDTTAVMFFSPVPHLSCPLSQKPHQMDQTMMFPFLSKLEWQVLCRHPISWKVRPLLSGSITRFTPKTKCHMHVACFKEIHLPCSQLRAHFLHLTHSKLLLRLSMRETAQAATGCHQRLIVFEHSLAKSFKSELDIHTLVYDELLKYIWTIQGVITSNPPKGDHLLSYIFLWLYSLCVSVFFFFFCDI